MSARKASIKAQADLNKREAAERAKKSTPAQRLAMIRLIFNTERKVKVDGHNVTSSTHAGFNLMGAIYDIERQGGKCDKVSLKTLKRVESQLARISAVLDL